MKGLDGEGYMDRRMDVKREGRGKSHCKKWPPLALSWKAMVCLSAQKYADASATKVERRANR